MTSAPTRPAPGTAATLNDACPWPERRGLLAHVVGTWDAEHEYPAHGLGKAEVIVYISDDPLEKPAGPAMLANGNPWSCVMPIAALSALVVGPEPFTLGAYIRNKRMAAGMNQTRLGELIEQPQHVVSEYELDKRTPGARTLALLAEHLPGATAAELLALIPGSR